MRFRPCIDIHNGKVKQIIGRTMNDAGNNARTNFISDKSAEYFAKIFVDRGLLNGHLITLNAKDSIYWKRNVESAMNVLKKFPGCFTYGGCVNNFNAESFINLGASHVIISSYIFENDKIQLTKIRQLANIIGANRIVLDLSVMYNGNNYSIMTQRWQKKTDEILSFELLNKLSMLCDEFIVHSIDVEGNMKGIDTRLLYLLSEIHIEKKIIYAGGISTYNDIEKIYSYKNIDFTIGSGLNIYGGKLDLDQIISSYP